MVHKVYPKLWLEEGWLHISNELMKALKVSHHDTRELKSMDSVDGNFSEGAVLVIYNPTQVGSKKVLLKHVEWMCNELKELTKAEKRIEDNNFL